MVSMKELSKEIHKQLNVEYDKPFRIDLLLLRKKDLIKLKEAIENYGR